jgi:hypothetical protein
LGVQSAGWLDTDFAVSYFPQNGCIISDKNAHTQPVLLAHIVYFFR